MNMEVVHLQAMIAILFMPFAAAIFVFLFGAFLRKTVVVGYSIATVFLALSLGEEVYRNGEIRYLMGGWGAPLGIDLFLDGLSAMMLIITTIIGAGVSIYALGYFNLQKTSKNRDTFESQSENFFWPLWFFALGALNAVFLTADIFNVYVAVEVMTFSVIALITLEGSEIALSSAARYLFVTLLGSLAYLLGVGMLYSAYGLLDIASLERVIKFDDTTTFAAALIMIGLIIKSALFPMHFWLPAAHANAPSPVSAMLSGLIITAPIYLMIRFWFTLFETIQTAYLSQFLGILGTAAIFWGAIQALRQKQLKMLVAYSTVAQIGYIFLLFPLAGVLSEGQVFAWSGGVLFALSHALAKAAAFMSAGLIKQQLGHDRIDEFQGLSRSSSLAVFVFALSGASLIGMPPTGGFVAKWLLLKAAMLSEQWWYAFVIIAGGLLAACYIFRVLEITLQNATRNAIPSSASSRMEYASLAIVLVSFGLGLGATIPLNLLKINMPHFLVFSAEVIP